MKKYVRSDYDPNGPLSYDEFATLQEISEQTNDIDNISIDLFNAITDKWEDWCNNLGLDMYKLDFFNTSKTIDKLCDELATQTYNAYINKQI